MHTSIRVYNHRKQYPKGAIAPLIALLLIPLLVFVAFCVDIGWITKTKSELQNAADAAVAAGARQLADNYGAYSVAGNQNRATLIANAKNIASTYINAYGQYNGASDAKTLSILSSDIQYGFTNADGDFNASYAGYPNTVQVAARRDSNANSQLSLFFGSITGRTSESLVASASATVYTGLISSFDPKGGGVSSGATFTGGGGGWGDFYGSSGGGFNCSLLPVAFDVNYWNAFVATAVSPDGSMNTGADGAAQIKIYPSPDQAPGNVGLLCIGPPTNSDPSYADWIENGPSPSDLQYLIDDGQVPVSQQAPQAWKGSPGLKSNLVNSFAAIVDQPRLLPLFKAASTSPYQAASGNGSNATYNIVGFVGVTVTSATGNGSNMSICVKPCGVVDPTAVFDPSTVYPAGAQPMGQLQAFSFVGTKLTK